jgi:hypothetical protein
MPTYPARNSGDQTTNYLRAPFTFGLGTAGILQVGTLPAGCIVLRVYVVVSTVFNWGTNNLIKVGITGADTTFGASISLTTLGTVAATLLGTANVAPTVDTPVIATSLATGTQATTGAGFVVVEYCPVA